MFCNQLISANMKKLRLHSQYIFGLESDYQKKKCNKLIQKCDFNNN